MSNDVDPWRCFNHDPRDPAHSALRAADSDREVVQGLLSSAYADGRLDREELDERTSRVAAARTLGELPPLVTDLVPEQRRPPPSASLVAASADDLQGRALETWHSERRNALLAFLGSTLICWAIWTATSFGGDGFHANFPWPLIVMAATAFNLGRTQLTRDETVRDEVRRLEKLQAKQIERRASGVDGPHDQLPSDG